MRARFIFVVCVLYTVTENCFCNGKNSSDTNGQPQPQQVAKKMSASFKAAGSVWASAPKIEPQISKDKNGNDQVAAGARNTRQTHYSQNQPKTYSYNYDSGPKTQYYEVTSKPVSYHQEYHSPPSSYSHSYDSGPQGYSHNSPPQQSQHSNSYNHQDGNQYSDGDSSSNGYNQGDDDGYGDSDYQNDHQGEYSDAGDSIEY